MNVPGSAWGEERSERATIIAGDRTKYLVRGFAIEGAELFDAHPVQASVFFTSLYLQRKIDTPYRQQALVDNRCKAVLLTPTPTNCLLLMPQEISYIWAKPATHLFHASRAGSLCSVGRASPISRAILDTFGRSRISLCVYFSFYTY